MQKLAKIEIWNFKHIKHQSFEFDGKTAYIFGKNGSGKSTVLQAIELMRTGRIADPENPAKSIDLLRFVSVRDIKVRGTYQDESGNTLEVTRKFVVKENEGKCSLTQYLDIDPAPPGIAGVKKGDEYLDETLGKPVSLDFRTFFQQSAAKQFSHLFQICAPVVPTSVELVDEIINRFESDDEEKREILGHLLENVFKLPTNLSGVDVVNGAEEKAFKIWKDLNASTRGSRAVVQQVSAIMAEKQKIAGDLDQLSSDIEEAQSKILDLNTKIGEINLLESQIENLEQEKLRLNAEILTNEKLQNAKNVKVESLRSEAGDGVPVNENLLEYVNRLTKEIEQYDASMESVDVGLEAAHRAASDATAKRDLINTSRESGCCALCGNKQLEHRFPDEDQIEDAIENCTALYNKRHELQKARENATAHRDKVRDLAQALYDVEQYQLRIDGYKEKVKNTEREIAQKTKAIHKIGNKKDFEQLIAGLKLRQQESQYQLNLKNQEHGKLIIQEEAAQQFHLDKEKLEIVTYIRKEIANIKAQMIEQAFSRFRAQVDRDFQQINGNGATFDIQFRDQRGNEVFQIGMVTDPINGGFVEYGAVNTAHRIKILLAFLLNLNTSGNRMYLLDNMEVLSPEYRAAFIEGLKQLEDKFDNLIVASSQVFESVNGTVLQ